MANFKCSKCGHITVILRIIYKYSDGGMVPVTPIYCEKCKSSTVELKKEYTGVPYFGKFSSSSDEEKKRILKKRANKHYNKQGKEEKRENFKKVMNGVKGRANGE